MKGQGGSEALAESVRSIASRLQSDRSKNIDPAETWASIRGTLEQHKSDVQNNPDSSRLEHMYVALLEDLTSLAEGLHAEVVKGRSEESDESLHAADPDPRGFVPEDDE